MRVYTLAIVQKVLEASYEGRWQAIARLVDLYDEAHPYCREEPLRCTYEHGLMHISLILADNNYVNGNLRQALLDAEAVLDNLDILDRRRESLGLAPRRNSELRLLAFNTLAGCLAEHHPLISEAGLAAEEIVKEFWRIAEVYLLGLDQLPKDSEKISASIHSIGTAELEICKLSLALAPDLTKEAVRRFNSRQGDHLELPVGHFRAAENQTRSAWYWDFELSKLRASAENCTDDMKLCAANRLAAARLTFGGNTLRALRRLWNRQFANY